MIERPPFAWKPVGTIAAGAAVALLVTITRYDYHRDELYFRMLGSDPKWGYVDQPPFTPLLMRACVELFGDSVWAIRLPGLILTVLTAGLLALIAREVGGGARAQGIAALAVLTTFPLVSGHVTVTTGPDLVMWLLAILCMMRALLREQPRYWLAAGLVVGLALYNKHLIVLLLLTVAVALLLVGPRRTLASPWLWGGVAIAVVVGLPNLLYQIANDFPQVSMAGALRENKGDEARITLLPLQLVWLGPIFVPVWYCGIVALLRDPALRAVRAFGLAYPLMLVLLFVLAGQPYYSVGLLAALFAVGSVPVERWLSTTRRRALFAAGAVVNCGIAIVSSLPLIPVGVVGQTPIPAMNQVVADQIGWPRYVRQVADVYESLPAEDRARTVLLTGNYGEAGALDRYGKPLGLPDVYSGQNELWHLGPPPESATVVVFVFQGDPDRLRSFGSCEERARLDNGYGVENEEQTARVYVCRDLNGSWAELWPRFQHFD
ncbi:glycosyltransferase family 39 protein [Dactylosporangium sp. AC04546]|uniref:glycosyltransferase family 39 protein n=1 Tax=Dactylosporangium sp. AC04546 TaxID=2862460 RepID=UPI001EDD0D64|nr:glycosyltransferase family 39 protein [Dactylosporangium sp. AC04546]WVK84546.1 glycosyltransferase family 39 protein [Dactylosporangium sp. AC04546]